MARRPEGQSGQPLYIKEKRDLEHAEKALEDHDRDQQHNVDLGYGYKPWDAWIEEREVTEWRKR